MNNEFPFFNIDQLQEFIVAAKSACYVGEGSNSKPCRLGSHDLFYENGDWSYLDSYFGGTNFSGQETVWYHDSPLWCMSYYGWIIDHEQIDAERAGETIKSALSKLYEQGRFLGGFEWQGVHGVYRDKSEGDTKRFSGFEEILIKDKPVYRLEYFGGIVY